jgi:hypothetical protein
MWRRRDYDVATRATDIYARPDAIRCPDSLGIADIHTRWKPPKIVTAAAACDAGKSRRERTMLHLKRHQTGHPVDGRRFRLARRWWLGVDVENPNTRRLASGQPDAGMGIFAPPIRHLSGIRCGIETASPITDGWDLT